MSAAFQIFTLPSQQALDASARVRAGAKLYFYLTGTSTPTDAYADSGLTTPIANPLKADSGGVFAQFFLDPDVTYRIVMKDAAGAVIGGPWDPANENMLAAIDSDFIGTTLDSLKRTDAEIAAGVTPVNYAYEPEPVLDGARYGFVGDGVTLNNTAMAKAISVITALGGGTLMLKKGIYLFSAGFAPPESMIIQGSGRLSTALKANGNFTLIALQSARVQLKDLQLVGTSKTGTGVQVGSTSFAGQNTLDNVHISGFNIGLRMAAGLWTAIIDCVIEHNKYGVDFNAGSGSVNSNATTFINTLLSLNDRNGIAASNTPVRNTGLQWIGGSIENNGSEAPATYPQVVLGACAGFYFNFYGIEYGLGGTLPIGFDLTNTNNGEIANLHFLNSSTGIKANSGSANNIFIHDCRFVSTSSKCIDMDSCQYVIALHNIYDVSANVINGANSTDITNRLPNSVQNSYTGTLNGGVTTNPTASIAYTMVDDVVTLSIPSLQATSNATTQPNITGMPASIRPSAVRSCIGIASDNTTNVISRYIVNTSGQIDIYNGVSATFTASGQKGSGASSISYKI